MVFPKNEKARKWTPTEIDQLDVHFFNELLDEYEDGPVQQAEEKYLSDIW